MYLIKRKVWIIHRNISIFDGKGKIITGIILFLVGIIAAGFGLFVYTIQFNDLQDCNLISFNQLDQNVSSSMLQTW